MLIKRNYFIILLLGFFFLLCQFLSLYTYTNNNNNNSNQLNENDYYTSFEKSNKIEQSEQIVNVVTDVLSLKISTRGGNVKQAILSKYINKLKSFNKPIYLFETSKNFIYQAESGILNKLSKNQSEIYSNPLFNVKKDFYCLKKGQNELRVPLMYMSPDNVFYVKTFVFERGSYNCNVEYNIINMSNKLLKLCFYGQLKQNINLSLNNKYNNLYNNRNFAVFTTNNKYNNYKKYNFTNIKNTNNLNLNFYSKIGWVSMFQKYFASCWIPSNLNKNNFYVNYLDDKKQIIVGFKYNFIVHSKSKFNTCAVLRMGPKIQNDLLNTAPHLDYIIDYGGLWFISKLLFQLLQFIYVNIVNNWGGAIILITFLIRFLIYPLTKAQCISINKMNLLKFELKKINNKYNNNNNDKNKEIIKLYKKNKINPFFNFVSLIIQVPIFWGLYNMLLESVELHNAKFILWINDLSSYDNFFILPIIMGVIMFFNSLHSLKLSNYSFLNRFCFLLPFLFILVFLWFPSGLIIYYIINNIINIIQQKFLIKKLN